METAKQFNMRDKIIEILYESNGHGGGADHIEKFIISLLEEKDRVCTKRIFDLQQSYRKQFEWIKDQYPEAYKGLSEHHRKTDDFKVESLESQLSEKDKEIERLKSFIDELLSDGIRDNRWKKQNNL
jgi:hypothetical protein